MEFNEVIMGRKSIRSFENRPIEQDKINQLINSAIFAPSASNRQAWKFIQINDAKIKENICANNGGGIQTAHNLILDSPCGILVLYRNDVSWNNLYRDHIQSASAAIQNMLLTAHSLGLGATWLCKLPKPKYLRKLLHIPNYYDVIAYIILGYPKDYLTDHTISHYENDIAKTISRKRKYDVNEVLSINSFNDTKCPDAFKYRHILFLLHRIHLSLRSDSKNFKTVKTLLNKLILHLSNKKK